MHFSHVRSRKHDLTEQALLGVRPPLQIAYVRHDMDTGRIHRKGRLETRISTAGSRLRRTVLQPQPKPGS